VPKIVRRVVTGEPEPGSSTFTHVEEVEPIVVGESKFYGVWGYDGAPSLPWNETGEYVHRSMFPEAGGLRVNVVVYPPKGAKVDPETADSDAYKQAAEARTQLLHAVPHGHKRDPGYGPGMHRTDSIDVGVVISGKLGITNTDGSTHVLEPGDIYVQNGAMHSWEGLAEGEQSMIAFIVVPAERQAE
jgi:hypothetical protein